jgi:hypothetical protein
MDIINTYILGLCNEYKCSEYGPVATSYDHGTENSGSIKGR